MDWEWNGTSLLAVTFSALAFAIDARCGTWPYRQLIVQCRPTSRTIPGYFKRIFHRMVVMPPTPNSKSNLNWQGYDGLCRSQADQMNCSFRIAKGVLHRSPDFYLPEPAIYIYIVLSEQFPTSTMPTPQIFAGATSIHFTVLWPEVNTLEVNYHHLWVGQRETPSSVPIAMSPIQLSGIRHARHTSCQQV